jgi:hypothetical protein
VIKIQIVAIENVSAVLAGILISLKNVVPCELDFLFWKPVEKAEENHPRNPDLE